jgi:hypothetical protein
LFVATGLGLGCLSLPTAFRSTIGYPVFNGFAFPESGLAAHRQIGLGELAGTHPPPKRAIGKRKKMLSH